MGKAEDKRAAVVAQQAARELAERALRQASGTATPPPGKRKTNWAASPPFAGFRRGRPPKAGE